MRGSGAIVGLGLLLGIGALAGADSVTLTGSAIPLRDCTIRAIRGGRLYFVDGGGQSRRRGLEEVRAITFDGLDQLTAAERAIASQDYRRALDDLLQGLVAAETDLQRLWLHARLARVHGILGEYVQAAGHAAAVYLIEEDPYWRRLEPLCAVNEPAYAAAREANELLERADRTVANAQLASVVRDLRAAVRPVHDRLKRTYDGPPIAPGSTISGIPRSRIVTALRPAPPRADGTPPAPSGRGGPSPPTAATAPPSLAEDPDSTAAVEALLAADRPAEALVICRRVALEPGDRDLSRFLHVYGLVLAAVGHGPDAAVMFMRCAVLFPESPVAASSLIETALIYRDTYGRPGTARRLLDRALRRASALDQPAVADRARRILESLAHPSMPRPPA
ncbi:MAG: hypothetical protein ACYS0G_01255 [Planctomycetota bacterium]|jgi:tetratricopeptide (TPR) repeat protein